MSEQLPLIPPDTTPRPPTPLQQAVLDAVTNAGPDGLDATTAGAVYHARRGANPHPADQRCDWCRQDGRAVLVALRAKGLVVERRKLGAWVATTPAAPADTPLDGIPVFNSMPTNF